jgi:spermidine/putrescine transport system permease protein
VRATGAAHAPGADTAPTGIDGRAIARRRLVLWLAPPMLWFSAFMLVPYAIMFFYSLGSMDYVDFVPGFSAANYVKALTAEPYPDVLLKSTVNGMLTALLSSAIAFPLALWMAFGLASPRRRALVSILVVLPWWASYLVKVYAWKTILGAEGVLNTALLASGLVDEPLSVLLYNRFAVVLTLTYIFTPFAVLSIYAQLERIPRSLVEAARNLGATDGEIFRRIILPISVPGVLAGAVITFSLGFGDFVTPSLVGGPDDLMITNLVVNLLGVSMDRPLGSAIGVVVIAFSVLLLMAANAAERRTQVRF